MPVAIASARITPRGSAEPSRDRNQLLTSRAPRVDSTRVDIGARFREYVRLDKLRREGGLTPAELHRLRVLEGFLQDHFSPGKPAGVTDQRRSVRVPTRVQVSFATEGELVGSLMTNISRHGVFVQTDHPLDIKEQFLLHIHVDRPKRDISVPVEVVSLGIGPG
ncbi:MAG: PilZ domain-containing protein, partial [Myxococcota bacterium]